jgi:hypothetical protein
MDIKLVGMSEADDLISGKLLERWKPMTKKEKKKFDKMVQKHKEEVEKRTGMNYDDWMQEICEKLGL